MANTALVSLATRQQVLLERLKASDVKNLESFFREAADVIRKRLAAGELTELSAARAELQLSAIRDELQAIYSSAGTQITGNLTDLADYSAGAESRALQTALIEGVELTIPTAAQIMAAANARPLTSGKSAVMLESFIKDWSSKSVTAVENAIRVGYFEGQTNQQILKQVIGTKANRYADGVVDATARNARAVIQTSIQHVAQVARSEVFANNSDIVAEYEWVSTLDSRTSLQCAGLDGRVFPVGKGPLPPIHINCLAGDSLISACSDITGASKRWFDGEVVVIETSGDRSLTCTPNHPILTTAGWIAAGLLNDSHEIVCRPDSERLRGGNAEDNNRPASISDVTEAFFAHSSVIPMPVPVASPDFHGDGAGSKVAIVGANRSLLSEGNTFVSKHIGKGSLIVGNNANSCGCSLFKLLRAGLSASCSIVCGLSKSLNLFFARRIHSGLLLLRAVPFLDAIAVKNPFDRAGANSETLCDSSNTNAIIEKPNDFIVVNALGGNFRFRFYVDAASFENSKSSGVTDSDIASSLISGHSGEVEFHKLRSKRFINFSGHVYNLETVDWSYTANGIITHNCRSSVTPVINNKYIRETLRQGQTRASVDGQVPANLSYYEWLKTQPEAFQDQALGPMRGQLLRDGGLSAQRFQELQLGKNFEPLTLEQMRDLEPVAFERAGL